MPELKDEVVLTLSIIPINYLVILCNWEVHVHSRNLIKIVIIFVEMVRLV